MMSVKKRRDTQLSRVIINRGLDIPGGLSVATKELGGDYLPEGAVLSQPINGVAHVVKIARVTAETSTTEVKVAKYHNLKAGDFVMVTLASKAVEVTKVEEGKKEDVLTLSEAIGTLSKGTALVEAKAAATDDSTLKYQPLAIVGTGQVLQSMDNAITDAYPQAVVQNLYLPDFVAKFLPGIVNVGYFSV